MKKIGAKGCGRCSVGGMKWVGRSKEVKYLRLQGQWDINITILRGTGRNMVKRKCLTTCESKAFILYTCVSNEHLKLKYRLAVIASYWLHSVIVLHLVVYTN